MSNQKKSQFYQIAIEGLKAANKGSIFWSKAQAFELLNVTRKNANK